MKISRQKVAAEFKLFLTRQYFVLFFMVTTGLKLCLFTKLIGFTDTFYYMRVGYLFSFFSAVLLFTPVLFVKKHKKPVAFSIALLVTLVLYGDLTYYRFFQALPTFGLMDALSQTKDISSQAPSLLRWTDLILAIDLVAFLVFEGVAKWAFKSKWVKAHKDINVGVIEKVLLGLVAASIAFLVFAFSFMPLPKSKLKDAISWSFETRYNTQLFGLLGSHLIDAYRFVEENTTTISAEEKAQVLGWVKANMGAEKPASPLYGSAAGKRVIIVQVESLSNFVIGKKVEGQEITPNLNQLANTSNYYSDTRYIFGAGHTSDTDLVSNSSLFPLYDSAAFVRYGKDNYTGLAKILTEAGYKTDAFHAYNRNFWNRTVALKSLGYERFYAAESFPLGTSINMNGLNDYDFLDKTIGFIKAQPAKSLSYAITLSSHYPFHTYAATNGLKINVDSYPPFVGGYLENINYTDRAIGNFLDKLKTEGLYDDSLIVIYGDHNPTINDFEVPGLSYKNSGVEAKQVPLLVKLPGQTLGENHPETVTTQDIAPTVLDLVGIKARALMFGQSLFSNPERCDGGFIKRPQIAATCEAQIETEKQMDAKVIKYNLFGELFR